MPSYVVVGASRGIGYAFMQHLAKDPANIVVGTVRTLETAIEKAKADELKNVHFVKADLEDRNSLRKAAADTAKLTGGSLDYLIVNGVYGNVDIVQRFLDDFEDEPEFLDGELERSWKTNVVGYINSINAFLPLLRKGSAKKVLALSSGLADDEMAVKYELWENPVYSTTKAALNAVIARYAARYQKDGLLFLAISPGVVDTGDNSKCRSRKTFAELTTASVPPNSDMPSKLMSYASHFSGVITPAESVAMCLDVLNRATTLNGFSGAFVSHHGNKQWI